MDRVISSSFYEEDPREIYKVTSENLKKIYEVRFLNLRVFTILFIIVILSTVLNYNKWLESLFVTAIPAIALYLPLHFIDKIIDETHEMTKRELTEEIYLLLKDRSKAIVRRLKNIIKLEMLIFLIGIFLYNYVIDKGYVGEIISKMIVVYSYLFFILLITKIYIKQTISDKVIYKCTFDIYNKSIKRDLATLEKEMKEYIKSIRLEIEKLDYSSEKIILINQLNYICSNKAIKCKSSIEELINSGTKVKLLSENQIAALKEYNEKIKSINNCISTMLADLLVITADIKSIVKK